MSHFIIFQRIIYFQIPNFWHRLPARLHTFDELWISEVYLSCFLLASLNTCTMVIPHLSYSWKAPTRHFGVNNGQIDILRHIENLESKIFLSNKCVFFTRCLPIELALNEPTSLVHVSTCQFFSSICSKFAVECDWNYDFSKRSNFGGFLEIAEGTKFAVECVSYDNISQCLFRPHYEVFSGKNQKTLNVGKIRKYDEEKVFFFRGINVFIF